MEVLTVRSKENEPALGGSERTPDLVGDEPLELPDAGVPALEFPGVDGLKSWVFSLILYKAVCSTRDRCGPSGQPTVWGSGRRRLTPDMAVPSGPFSETATSGRVGEAVGQYGDGRTGNRYSDPLYAPVKRYLSRAGTGRAV
jgi:hypothetical protein